MELIKQLEEKIKKIFGSDTTGHDIGHLWRTLNYALKLQKKEGGDIEVIAVASFIHDMHRIMQTAQKRFVTPAESIPQIKELIADLPLTNQQKEHICHAIIHHEEYAFGKGGVTVTDIESKIVQDADNLELLGAMGLVRMIHYQQAHRQALYYPNKKLYRDEFEEGTQVEQSLAQVIYNKALRLGESMNTKTARKLAKSKTKFLQDFLNLLVEEHIEDGIKD